MSYLPSLSPPATLNDISRTYPESYAALAEYHEIVMRGPSPFSAGERELIAAHVSRLNDCAYCIAIHDRCATLLGIDRALLEGLPDSIDGPDMPARLRPVMRYAGKLTCEPDRMTRADADTIYQAGWGEDALYAVVSVSACYNLYNRLVSGLDLGADEGYLDAVAEQLTRGARKGS
jgi:uncharacterized peroxidase-related enzyme